MPIFDYTRSSASTSRRPPGLGKPPCRRSLKLPWPARRTNPHELPRCDVHPHAAIPLLLQLSAQSSLALLLGRRLLPLEPDGFLIALRERPLLLRWRFRCRPEPRLQAMG